MHECQPLPYSLNFFSACVPSFRWTGQGLFIWDYLDLDCEFPHDKAVAGTSFFLFLAHLPACYHATHHLSFLPDGKVFSVTEDIPPSDPGRVPSLSKTGS